MQIPPFRYWNKSTISCHSKSKVITKTPETIEDANEEPLSEVAEVKEQYNVVPQS